jgi:hypothetical protein
VPQAAAFTQPSASHSAGAASGDVEDTGGRPPWSAVSGDIEDTSGRPPWSAVIVHTENTGGRSSSWVGPAPLPPSPKSADDEVTDRLNALETQMGRVCELIGDLRRNERITTNDLLKVHDNIVEIKKWTSWTSRFYDWAYNALKDFPWS